MLARSDKDSHGVTGPFRVDCFHQGIIVTTSEYVSGTDTRSDVEGIVGKSIMTKILGDSSVCDTWAFEDQHMVKHVGPF